MRIYYKWIMAIVLGLVIGSQISTCTKNLLSEAKDQMCAEGSLKEEHCMEVSEPKADE